MDLVELHRDKLSLGQKLSFTLRDESGAILLVKGQSIDTAAQLEGLRSRKALFVEFEESEGAHRVMMSGLVKLDLAGAPIKDFSKFLHLKKEPTQAKLNGSLQQRWSDIESHLVGTLASFSSATNFEQRIHTLDSHIRTLIAEDNSSSQFLLFHRAVTHFDGYSALHSLLCGVLCHSLAEIFALSEQERLALVCAALTMNIAMTSLQNELAIQKNELSPQQRRIVNNHTASGRQMLIHAGVLDMLWLETVALHHTPLDGPENFAEWPQFKRLAKILQTVDRYTAAMSPRKSRAGRTARDSVRTVIVQAGTAKHDEVGTALVRILGLSPPGTYVKLSNGETAVVMRRGLKPSEPWVASVLNRNDEPIAEPRLHNLGRENLPIQSTLVATSIRVNLKLEALLRAMPRA